MSIRQTVLERARRRCQQCSVKFSPSVHPDFEHINGSLKDDRPNNLRALCPECFQLVAKKRKSQGNCWEHSLHIRTHVTKIAEHIAA